MECSLLGSACLICAICTPSYVSRDGDLTVFVVAGSVSHLIPDTPVYLVYIIKGNYLHTKRSKKGMWNIIELSSSDRR